jgi:hypothetical protein
MDQVAALDDDDWIEARLRAEWLEERQIQRIKAGLLHALIQAFKG